MQFLKPQFIQGRITWSSQNLLGHPVPDRIATIIRYTDVLCKTSCLLTFRPAVSSLITLRVTRALKGRGRAEEELQSFYTFFSQFVLHCTYQLGFHFCTWQQKKLSKSELAYLKNNNCKLSFLLQIILLFSVVIFLINTVNCVGLKIHMIVILIVNSFFGSWQFMSLLSKKGGHNVKWLF